MTLLLKLMQGLDAVAYIIDITGLETITASLTAFITPEIQAPVATSREGFSSFQMFCITSEWLSKGHGEYREIPSEREFFQEVKESENVVCHFYRDSTFRCKILDRHLAILSKKHLETKFLKLNVEKAPFLCERLRIKVIPTLALLKDGKTQDYVVGFTDLGNTDDFTTETLEWRLGSSDILNYSGNLMEPPFQNQKKFGTNFTKLEKKTIRGKKYDSDSDDD
ncbi:thioredoxin domain-containing protein 9-like [Pongo abelii]|uniref:thioredoxin domain-containing protein 9-like n=1 Tax=Pongo abelii TaxID=9601 RepID=UPI0023E82C6A|nr:thioredoxin domain-containing protein 9-like [Pongo abelii]